MTHRAFTRSRWRIPLAVQVVTLLLGAGGSYLVYQSDHVGDPTHAIVLGALVTCAFAIAGSIALWRRPGHPFGVLLVAAGLASIVGTLVASDNDVVFTVGMLLANVATGVYVHCVLAFPEGRLHSRAERVVVAVTYLLVTVGSLLQLLLTDTLHGCAAACPENLLVVHSRPQAAHTVSVVESWIGVAVGVSVVLLLHERFRAASGPRRRAFLPMLVASSITAAFFVAQLIAQTMSERLAEHITWGTMVSLSFVPFAFVAGLVRSRLAGLSVSELVIRLGRGTEPGGLRDALARALGDPTLQVAYWLPAEGGWVSSGGARLSLPGSGSGRAVTELEQDGRRVAALVHDPALLDEPGLLDAVSAAAGLALANERMQAELRAHVADLEHERDFTRAVVETVPSLLIVTDVRGRIVEFNRACEALSGWTAAEARGRTLWELVIDRSEREALDAAFHPSALPNVHENHWVTRSGERRLILWHNTGVRGPDGEVEFVIGGGLDITERQAQEAEVKAQRARIVEAADAERRRLERNLHDGAQQRLVSLSLTLRLARGRVREKPGDAEGLLDAASEELAHALAELRELARGIHPAVLTDRGLGPALDALVARTPLPVEVEDGLGDERLPGPVEAAAYYVVSEALANAAKYAEASAVAVTIRRVNGTAIVQVRDDGCGGADPAAGTGLRGLRDRVEALDGRLVVESHPGDGTMIRAELPCAS